ncbi:hypothetical protein V8G54_024829 [Vigna mungo]|uniref:Uncharacterized protein n=1 Tax=Vigna mungo TaxID=3915 RepID=A0AAQ3RSY9_VIGMU
MVVVVVLIAIIVCVTPFLIILSLGTRLSLHQRKPIKGQDFPILASQNPINCRTPKVQEAGTKIRVSRRMNFCCSSNSLCLSLSCDQISISMNGRAEGTKTKTWINKEENIQLSTM